MGKTVYHTVQFVCASGELSYILDSFRPQCSAGTLKSVSGRSTTGSFEVYLFETDVSSTWGGASSPELARHNQCYYKESSTPRLLEVGDWEFTPRDSTTPRTLWLGVKDLAGSGTASIDLTLRWVVNDAGGIGEDVGELVSSSSSSSSSSSRSSSSSSLSSSSRSSSSSSLSAAA